MSIPNYQYFMLPVLKAARNGTVSISDIIETIANEAHISEEDRKIKTSTGATLLYSRISWAKSYMVQAGLLEIVGRGLFKVTKEGLELLALNPKEINNKTLSKYPSFNLFKQRSKKAKEKGANNIDDSDLDDLDPEEALGQSLKNLNFSLANELITRIVKAKPEFLENLIGSLLKAMGYSNNTNTDWEHTGKTGDDGIDGIINQDVLGVDKIYVQAKRYANNNHVTAGDLRNFIGALDMKRAVKGVFVTTSDFTNDAKSTVEKSTKNIVLINGEQLAHLMIQYGVGCKTKETIKIQKIDEDFFEEM